MFGLFARLVGGVVSPFFDRLSAFGASLARKLALFLVAGVCLVVVVIALTIAFALWIASLAGPIVGALAVAGLYIFVAGLALVAALREKRPATDKASEEATAPLRDEEAVGRSAQIDSFIAPLLNTLQRLGLRREQLAVLAGASVAKQLRPLPLLGLAIVAGFLIGRVWTGWGALLSTDLVTRILAYVGMASQQPDVPQPEDMTA